MLTTKQKERLPSHSARIYEKALKVFVEWRSEKYPSMAPTAMITELHVLEYLKACRGFGIQRSTLYQRNSILKRCFAAKAKGGIDLSSVIWPTVADYLADEAKKDGPAKKATPVPPTFAKDICALQRKESITQSQFLFHRAVALVSFYGGLRFAEVHSLERTDIADVTDEGVWIKFLRVKQVKRPEDVYFLVPRWADADNSPADVLNEYVTRLRHDCAEGIQNGASLWPPYLWCKGASGNWIITGFKGKGRQSVGALRTTVKITMSWLIDAGCTHNLIKSDLTSEFTNRWSSHSVRRGAATSLASSGVPLTEIMLFMGWRSEKTALGYMMKSKAMLSRMSNALTTNALTSSPAPRASSPLFCAPHAPSALSAPPVACGGFTDPVYSTHNPRMSNALTDSSAPPGPPPLITAPHAPSALSAPPVVFGGFTDPAHVTHNPHYMAPPSTQPAEMQVPYFDPTVHIAMPTWESVLPPPLPQVPPHPSGGASPPGMAADDAMADDDGFAPPAKRHRPA